MNNRRLLKGLNSALSKKEHLKISDATYLSLLYKSYKTLYVDPIFKSRYRFIEGGNTTLKDGTVVKIKDFFIAEACITAKEWDMIYDIPMVNINLIPSKSNKSSAPINYVNRFECIEFCERLSKATGRKYRLPYSYEWDYIYSKTNRSELTHFVGKLWEWTIDPSRIEIGITKGGDRITDIYFSELYINSLTMRIPPIMMRPNIGFRTVLEI